MVVEFLGILQWLVETQMQVDTNPVNDDFFSCIGFLKMRSKLGFTLNTVLSGGRMVRCHHGSQGASFALSSCAVGLTLGPSVFFFCLSGSRADLLPYSSQPNPLAANDNNKARLAVSWLDSVVDRIFTGCLLSFTW